MITWHPPTTTPEQRHALTRVKPAVLWLTGLSGSGKSTLAMALEHALISRGHLAFTLDGDNVRHGLNKNLTFTPADRTENIRRIGEVAKLFTEAGLLAITSFISPFRADRDAVRELVAPGRFIEVFVDAPLEICEQRDPKGLYKRARAGIAEGKSMQFTGLDSPYEPPLAPELHVHSDRTPPEALVRQVVGYLEEKGHLLPAGGTGLRNQE
ncbi:MAG TPA: adenylyl-sulfate kinase [Phycisphaerae bacterium]|jgi:adenylylsulfate kinase|nr:adenylyl-sulfate kinase [Phycisphaerae bacterium]